MASKEGGAYGGATTTTGKERKTWDKAAYADKAKEKDEEYAARAKERAEALKQGKKAPRRRTEVLPKATKLLEAREEPMELDKNMNKTVIVASGRPGFTCEMCRWTVKDSASYLDHVNGRFHLRKLGQTTKVARSTLQEVQAKIQSLREQSAKRMDAKKYDFQQRLKDLKQIEEDDAQLRKEKKREEKERRAAFEKEQAEKDADPEMMAAMGFASFG